MFIPDRSNLAKMQTINRIEQCKCNAKKISKITSWILQLKKKSMKIFSFSRVFFLLQIQKLKTFTILKSRKYFLNLHPKKYMTIKNKHSLQIT